jgi:hypothetical protein
MKDPPSLIAGDNRESHMAETGKKSNWQEHGSGMYSIEVPFQDLDLVGRRIIGWAGTAEMEGIRQLIQSEIVSVNPEASKPDQPKVGE